MFAALAKFRVIDRTINGQHASRRPAALVASNNNVLANRPAAIRRHRPALVGYWRLDARTGRLEWHWTIERIESAPADNPGLLPRPTSPVALPIGHTREVVFSGRRAGAAPSSNRHVVQCCSAIDVGGRARCPDRARGEA